MKKTGRYHNDYSPRYTEAFDIYEKAKNHVKAQKKKERLRSLSIIEQEHGNRSCDDNSVSDKAGICLRNRKPRTVEKIICE